MIVKQKSILDIQYTGRYGLMQMVNNTVRRVPKATVHIESQYLKVEVSTVCPPDTVYDAVVGNVPSTRAADNSNPLWHMANLVTTRSNAKKVGDATLVNVRTVRNCSRLTNTRL